MNERNALLHTARTLRESQRVTEALSVLSQLEATHPRFSRLYQERAHCLIMLGDGPAAVAALQTAVSLNPTLPASWDMLAQLCHRLGDLSQADRAKQHLAALGQVPPQVVMANALYADGDLAPAEAALRAYLRLDGGNVGALRLLARIRSDQGGYAEAERLLEAVLKRAPDYDEARFDYAMALMQQQNHQAAREETERLLRHDPDNRDYLRQYGAACIGLGDYEPLIDLYKTLLDKAPQTGQAPSQIETADLWFWRANALKTTGRTEEAIADYKASVAARPDSGAPWFALANLKTYRFSAADIAQMQATQGQASLQDMDRIYLSFALGKAQEDCGDYDSAWHAYARGNALRRQTSRYRPEVAEACAHRLKQVFTHDFFADRAGFGVDDPAPIFVLGLPRSGSTLIEQILASHSQVEGTQELTQIGRYAGELCGLDPDCGLPMKPEALKHLTREDARRLGERFLAETRIYRRLGRPFFIDKMPNNFWYIGLINLILPRATLIDIRREPMAGCFSNFKQLFGMTNQEFTYDLDHMARHYRIYIDLMRHWNDTLPGRVLRLHYEDVVDDLKSAVRRLLAQAGLSYEPACLDFHATRRSVRTPSAEQVRQPIFREAVDQWQHFAPWLAPLRDALGDTLTTYRD